VPLFETYADTDDVSSLESCVGTFQALLAAIPTFWGSRELTQVIRLTINYPSARGISDVIKSLAKRVPSKALIPTLVDMWPSIQSLHDKVSCNQISIWNNVEHSFQSSGKYISYFETFKRSLKAATQAVVLEHLRSLTKLFMESFDLVSVPSYDAASVCSISIYYYAMSLTLL
jgi:U3 small nucleolar RNA-associated protein 10